MSPRAAGARRGRRPLGPFLVAGAAALLVAGLGGAATDLGPWYQGLRQPAWKPPDLAFPVVWTLVFGLCAVAGALAWRGAATRAERARVVALFAANGALNVLWSLLFFRLRRPDWALVEVPFLWLSILALIVGLSPLSRAAGRVLVVYLAWVGFAAALNLAVVVLNAPFAARAAAAAGGG